jgi:AcrR family transcriptional regulator
MSPRRAKAVGGGRVGDDPAAALRELLIDATEGLISRGSISAITTRDIARAAGVSDGVLYNYFADKQELILAALVRRYQRLARRFFDSRPQAGTGTVEDNLVGFASRLLDLLVEALPIVAGLMTEPVLFHRMLDQIHRDDELSPQAMQAGLGAYLVEEQRLGRLGEVNVTPVGTLLMGAVVVIAMESQFTPVPVPAGGDPRLRAAVSTILRGLA